MTEILEPPSRRTTKHRGTALRVKGHGPGFTFGKEPHGKVLPIWVAELCGRTAEQLVLDGDMEWTDDEPVGDWQAPKPKKNTDETAQFEAMSEESSRLRRKNFELTGENRQLTGENAELKRTKELQITQLGEQSADIAHWRKAAEEYRVHSETMTAAYEESKKTVESLTAKNTELEDRLAALMKVPAPKKGKTAETAPVATEPPLG
jgi:predicted RNase H-like nuclease (RuvC/YqgF family)